MDKYDEAIRKAKVRIAVDIGANDGGYTRTLVSHGMKVHAFEPVPDMFQKLVELHADNPNVTCLPYGLSDEPGVVRDVQVLRAWTLAPVGTGDLELSPDYKEHPPFNLHLTTLDDYLQGAPVGVIKLDVDGYEPRVLRGARKTLKTWRPQIMCELSAYPEKLGTPIECFVNQIFDLGYVIMSMDGKKVCRRWKEVHPHYPYHSSYDVMLIPEEQL